MENNKIFSSFFMGGFECSTHRLRSGKRLDEIAFTQHDRFALQDYRRLNDQGMFVSREGLRWHLIEKEPGRYDFSNELPLIRAAQATNSQVIWDLCHYGWPDWLDIFEPRFIDCFEKMSRAFAQVLKDEGIDVPFVCPVNEISFFSWAAAEFGYLNPFALHRGDELKEHLVRAAIAATEAVWDINSSTRIVQIDPLINVLPADPTDAAQVKAAEGYRQSQFQAWDMLAGRFKPHLGGSEKYLDIIGGNYYDHNQWILNGSFITPDNPRYIPLREIIGEVYHRYERPFLIAETGIEDDARPAWFRYVCGEAHAAMMNGVDLHGICLYPILNHPGWDDDRHCHNGLWDYADENGNREIYLPLAEEIQRQQELFEELVSV
jgi:beta-glucosidase/6-phospho-beta-glucosidase/beta-galactosidase